MRWACILLPHLALDGVLRRRAEPAAPLALITGSAQRRVLHAVNPAARALGLRAGMSLTAAQAVSRAVALAEYDAEDARRWHRFLAAWAYRFSSLVSLHFANALILEIEASLGLFGPWPRLEARLREELADLGFRHRIVMAPNPIAARALANGHDGLAILDPATMRQALGQLPVERVGFPIEVATAFSRMGLRQLQQVIALPRDTVARRFPASVLAQMDALLGEQPLPLQYYTPPDVFDVRIELGYEVESHQALLFPLKRLTADLASFLAGRDGGVQNFLLRLEHEDLPDTPVPVGLLAAERDPAMLFELARGRLEQAPVPAPVRGLRLLARELPPFVPAHRELFEQRPQQATAWPQLRERLRARLGNDAVHGLQANADHRPEQAWRADAETAAMGSASGRTSAGTSATTSATAGQGGGARAAPARPGWLLRQSIPWREFAPQLLAGPERIESGWWDGDDTRRDYYLAQTRAGQRAWIYCPTGEVGNFMLHGWFA